MLLHLQQIGEKLTLSELTDDLVKAVKDLKDISSDKIKAIETFVNCRDIVDWLHKNVAGYKK